MTEEGLRVEAVTRKEQLIAFIARGVEIKNRLPQDSPDLQRLTETLGWLDDYLKAIDKFIAGGKVIDLLRIQVALLERLQFIKQLLGR